MPDSSWPVLLILGWTPGFGTAPTAGFVREVVHGADIVVVTDSSGTSTNMCVLETADIVGDHILTLADVQRQARWIWGDVDEPLSSTSTSAQIAAYQGDLPSKLQVHPLKDNTDDGEASLLSIGGVGTLVLSLASKDVATELVSGLAIGGSDRFLPGEEVVLGDGTAGFISSINLLSTDIRGYDEVITRIPNSQLAGQRATNLSRAATKSQVKQTLRFSYKDVKSMTAVVEAIKEEIRACCPTLIDDGTRPFRAHWRNFAESWLEVVVDAHFNTRPTGDVYYDLRQNVLEAIARAADNVGVEFTLPASICKTERL